MVAMAGVLFRTLGRFRSYIFFGFFCHKTHFLHVECTSLLFVVSFQKNTLSTFFTQRSRLFDIVDVAHFFNTIGRLLQWIIE